MSQLALKILAATDPPRRLLIEDDTLKEVASLCPALLTRIQQPGAGRDKFTIGIMASFNRIHIAFDQNDLGNILREVTDDMMAETDALLNDTPKELKYVLDQLPLIMDLMEESEASGQKSESLGGIVLTYVTVARHLLDSSVSSAMADASGVELEEGDGPPVGGSPILDQSDGYNPAIPSPDHLKPTSVYTPDVKDVLKNLISAGVNMNDIQIKPHITKNPGGDDIVFKICGPLPRIDFDTIAKINAMFLKATGRGIHLESETPVNFTFQV